VLGIAGCTEAKPAISTQKAVVKLLEDQDVADVIAS